MEEVEFMKRFMAIVLLLTFILSNINMAVLAAPQGQTLLSASKSKPVTYNKNARTLVYAFVFDGPSDKNTQVMEQFKKAITVSTAPEYKASFPKENVFVGNWTESGAKKVAAQALNSNATMVVSLGWFVSNALNQTPNRNKFVLTIDQYGLRDLGDNFFNPVQQNIKGINLFAKVAPFKKGVVLMNENFYKTKKDWNAYAKAKLPNLNLTVVPVNNNIEPTIAKLDNYDAVIVTPLFNLTTEKRQALYNAINAKKLRSYSTLGKEDVEMGVLMGTGAYDLDRKVSEAMSFNIKSVLAGNTPKPRQVQFYEDELLFINKDTASDIGYKPHLRIMYTAEVISKRKPNAISLAEVFEKLYTSNLDIERKKLLVKAARRSAVSAALRYLPTLSVTYGYQSYNDGYAESAKLIYPKETGVFKLGMEQILYSPALVTNILIKKKSLDFSKYEEFMTEQNMGIDVASLYIDTLILQNAIRVQKDYVRESRENLAMARVREKMGYCGQEESLRWASEVNKHEQRLLDMSADLKNIKVQISKLLYQDQSNDFELVPIKATDDTFLTSEINIINYIAHEQGLEQLIKVLANGAYHVSPELAKLKTAQKMKKIELALYVQKFVLPDAKLQLEYTTLPGRHYASDFPTVMLPTYGGGGTPIGQTALPLNQLLTHSNKDSVYFGIFAQWKPIEGGTKFAEIARTKAELNELQRYEDEVRTQIEEEVRHHVNKAVAGYFSIDKNYKAMFASQENYSKVKAQYLAGKVPVSQLIDAQNIYLESKEKAINSQYVFFKDVFWIQRALCAVDWKNAPQEAHDFVKKMKQVLPYQEDITLL